jgi:hypothetical protein
MILLKFLFVYNLLMFMSKLLNLSKHIVSFTLTKKETVVLNFCEFSLILYYIIFLLTILFSNWVLNFLFLLLKLKILKVNQKSSNATLYTFIYSALINILMIYKQIFSFLAYSKLETGLVTKPNPLFLKFIFDSILK